MQRIISLAMLAVVVTSGCGDETITIPTSEHKGGSIEVADCNYTLTTRDRVSEPFKHRALLGAAPAPTFVHLGLRGDPSTSIVASWRTDYGTLVSQLELTKAGGAPEIIDGFFFDYTSDDSIQVRMHEVHVCGLTADTQYSYRVGGKDKDGKEAWSKSFTFRTAPAKSQPDAEIVALLIGDTRGDDVKWKQSIEQAFATERPDLVIFSGDAVTFGNFQEQWDPWFTATGELFAEVPFVTVHGNHELNSHVFFSQFALPGDEENWGLDYGSIHLTAINDLPTDASTVATTIKQFLSDDLAANASRPWRFVLNHQPIYSASLGHGSNLDLRAIIEPVYNTHRPDLVLNGHDHTYERTKPLRNGAVQANATDGTIFVIAGSSGAPLYDAGTDFWTEKSESSYSFVIMKLREKQLTATSYRPDGTVLDTFSITKP